MPDLTQSLQGRDLSHLRIVAQLWGIELHAPDARSGLQRLGAAMLKRAAVVEMIEGLPSEALAALDDLLRNEGRLPWPLFTRRFGAVREMGPARRDRERPYQGENSPAEVLWYRALVARAFFDTPDGPEEFAYIPDDLLALIPPPETGSSIPLGRPATPAERAYVFKAADRILDHACTLLAALRLGLSAEDVAWPEQREYPLTPAALQILLSAAGLLDASGLPQLEPVRAFLEAPRGEALAVLARAWIHTADFDELRLLPGLTVEGDWSNDPLRARHAVLDFLSTIPEAQWWSLPSFIAAIRQNQPDFQRPAGDYDSWFLREERSGEFLRGFENWDAVDGALIRYVVTGPLHWLGVLELASPAPEAGVTAFRRSAWAPRLLAGAAPEGLEVEGEQIVVRSDASLHIPRLAPRAARYQLARFGQWQGEKGDGYGYRLTPRSLERARQQGLRYSHLLALLKRHAPAVPPSLVKALERWEAHGTQARLEQVTVLRLSSPELLQALRTSRASRFLGDPLGPTTVVVQAGAWEKVLAALVELGYLAEGEIKKSPE